MIINNTFFKGEFYIPHAKPNVSDNVTEVSGNIIDFINDYSRECLFKSLGSLLFYEFKSVLDSNKQNGLKDGTDSKWNDLLNGKSYTDPITSQNVVWRGIRWKSFDEGNYDRSIITPYVYFHYESNDYITRGDSGHFINNPKNAEVVTPSFKVAKAWNKFVEFVQGSSETTKAFISKYGLGVDYFTEGGSNVSLYKFINDSNLIAEDTYSNFTPRTWSNINRFGI